MLRNTTLLWLLISYVLLQLAALFLRIGIFFYLVIYLVALIYAGVRTSRAVTKNGSLKPLFPTLLLFFVANLILFLIYLPALIYNPDINWKLKGEAEQDPMIFQAYVPIAFFCIALVVVSLTALVSKIVSNYMKRVHTG